MQWGKAIAAYVDGGAAQAVEELKEVLGAYAARPSNIGQSSFNRSRDNVHTAVWTDVGPGRAAHD